MLITAVSQPGRETGNAIGMKDDECDRLIFYRHQHSSSDRISKMTTLHILYEFGIMCNSAKP
ncbi:hypothetical protein GTQ43_19120 [Nostoc sp. KVJ3]|uniref:hypothetical protein n=1 Tax=Nostoc sp. KVJ3 TaxID=457945 RepID=UPI002238171C|nr:hypothetical protein [Nostoc sp. KVJ3]MCW5315845.1 hypothetical protein [Nostoc sp. KVJ3]